MRWVTFGPLLGLAFEFPGDSERDQEILGRFAGRYGIDYPLLLAEG